MKRITIAVAIAGIAALVALDAVAQCTKDTDCKGNRVCQNGQCVDQPEPGPAPAPAPAPAPSSGYAAPSSGYAAPAPAPPPEPRGPLSFFQSGYATVGLLLSFHGWGGWTDEWEGEEADGEIDGDFMPGFRLAGYGVVSEGFHIGGYWTFFKADFEVDPDDLPSDANSDVNAYMNMLGLTMKFGARLHERIWLGGATDIGLMITKGEIDGWGEDYEMKPMAGLVLFPRIDLDVLIVDTGAFRMAFTAAMGVFISPINGGHPYDSEDFEDIPPYDEIGDEISTRFWWISPTMMLGLSLGA